MFWIQTKYKNFDDMFREFIWVETNFIHMLFDFPGREVGWDLISSINLGKNKNILINGDDDYDGDDYDDYGREAGWNRVDTRINLGKNK